MFKTRSTKLERIDTGDYTPGEYERFLSEIAFINRYFGDRRALSRTLLREIEREDLREFSVLDVGSGSGELLRIIAEFARKTKRRVSLTGIDLNQISAATAKSLSSDYKEIAFVRGDALRLPFANCAFDYAISSLFFHHLTADQIPHVLNEMSRVARRGVVVIDLHRHPLAYVFYKVTCFVFRISPLVRHDGSLSILKGFKPDEMNHLLQTTTLRVKKVQRSAPFRIVINGIHKLPEHDHSTFFPLDS